MTTRVRIINLDRERRIAVQHLALHPNGAPSFVLASYTVDASSFLALPVNQASTHLRLTGGPAQCIVVENADASPTKVSVERYTLDADHKPLLLDAGTAANPCDIVELQLDDARQYAVVREVAA